MRTARQPRRRVALGLAAVMLGGGCSGDPGMIGLEEARSVLTSYVTAIGSGRIGEAMTLRCEAATVEGADLALFTSQAERLSAGRGDVRVDTVRVVDPPTGLKPLADLNDQVEVAFRLSAGGAELHTVVGREGGRPRLCGIATPEAPRLHDSLARQVVDLGPTSRDPRQLMPSRPGPGYQQVEDAGGGAATSGVTGSWSRAWQLGEYGGARVTAWRYETVAAAVVGVKERLGSVASDGVEQFGVPAAPGAAGVRYLGYAWLWVQTPSEGPFVDRVVMRYADRLVVVSASNLPSGSGHDIVAGLAAEVARLATT